jgi:very-short-patch-repair endonuclease
MFAAAGLAESQFGRVTWAQLRHLGVGEATINQWVNSGYLLPVMRRVYAVGHDATSQEARLIEPILFAGPDAVLSHGTAAWWRGLLSWPVASTHISTPRQIKTPPPRLTIHSRRRLDSETVNGLPVTTVTQTMLDLAASESLKLLRHALAQLDYAGGFAAAELYAACGHGRRGSAALARALRVHLPELARTRSELEVQFLLLCERFQIPMPLMNRTIHGVEADAWWPDFNLVVELDGNANHHTPAQRNRDLRKELTLRDHGVTVLRYDYHLATRSPSKIRDDLLSQMRER